MIGEKCLKVSLRDHDEKKVATHCSRARPCKIWNGQLHLFLKAEEGHLWEGSEKGNQIQPRRSLRQINFRKEYVQVKIR